MSILIIIESPGKIHKLKSILPNNYEILASIGHIRGLNPKCMSIDIANNYNPIYINMPDKKDVISNLKKHIKNSSKVILCADADTEGEAIAFSVAEVCNIKPEDRHRATFTEITKTAVLHAINNVGKIDMNRVYTQMARMCLDKIIGYTASPALHKEYSNFTLSAGRVQSCVLRLICEKEEIISKFNATSYYKIQAIFALDKTELTKKSSNIIETTCEQNITDKTIINKFYEDCSNDKIKFSILKLENSDSIRNPMSPLTTSTLQQEAHKLGMTPDICMSNAQKLYEQGLITYHRTDSVSLSEDCMKSLKTYIEKNYGTEYYRKFNYKNKNSNSQESHEAIRITDVNKTSVLDVSGLTMYHNRLYQLIWKRTVASQMTPCKLENKIIKIGETPNKKESLTFVGQHSKIIYDGYMKVMNMYKKINTQIAVDGENVDNEEDNDCEDSDDEDSKIDKQSNYLEKVFEKLKKGDPAFVKNMDSIEKYTKSKESRYNEASLIKKMESLSLGRPSTYASMIKKIQENQREYVQKKTIPSQKVDITRITFTYPNIINTETNKTLLPSDKNKLVPTSLGIMVNSFLKTNFIDVLNYDFIKTTEALLDKISLGEEVWYKVVDSVYLKLTPIIDLLDKNIQSRKLLKNSDPKADSPSRRNLGLNPETNLPIVCIKSKKGFLLIEENPVKKQSRFANFSSSFEDMTLDTALTLLVFPKNLGSYLETDIIIKKAKNIYIQYGDANYSIENYMNTNKQTTIDPESITLSEAQLIIDYYIKSKADKLENAKKDKVLNDDITIKTGPYGVYIKYKENANIKLPKKYKDNIDSLTLEDALAIVEKHNTTPAKGSKAGRFGAKGSAKPKPKSAEPKPKSAEPKPKAKKVKKESNKETKEPKAKEPKAKAVKVKPIKTKF
jgi:DNA topoisomerase-1